MTLIVEPIIHEISVTQQSNVVEIGSLGIQGPKGDPGEPGVNGTDGAAGPKGDKGDPGGSYTFIQGVPSSTWDITHNLGYNPNIIIIDSAGNVVEGSYEFPNVNRVIATFSSGFSGNAYLS